MEYYKENLEALKAYDEEAYNNYIEWKAEQIAGSELLIEEEVARDGSSVLNITKDTNYKIDIDVLNSLKQQILSGRRCRGMVPRTGSGKSGAGSKFFWIGKWNFC
ncbi:MAG: hypothetical protein ACOCNB_04500 [Acetivibrio ethanolgignens]